MAVLQGLKDPVPYHELMKRQAAYKRLAVQQFLLLVKGWNSRHKDHQHLRRGRVMRWGFEI